MKKVFIKFLLVLVIITLTLTMMPLILHADLVATDDFFIPDEGYNGHWTFFVPIKQVDVKIYNIYNPNDWWVSKFTHDGVDEPVSVTGIGTTDIYIDFMPGSRDEYRAYVKFYDAVVKSQTEAKEPATWVRDKEFQCWQVWVNEANQFEFVFVWEYANNNHVQILDKDGNIVFYIDLPKGDCQFVADLPDGTYTVQNYHEAGHILREFVISKP